MQLLRQECLMVIVETINAYAFVTMTITRDIADAIVTSNNGIHYIIVFAIFFLAVQIFTSNRKSNQTYHQYFFYPEPP